MADKKISALTAATTPLAGTEVLPIVQGGTTVKVTIANVTAGRSPSALTFSADNASGSGVLGWNSLTFTRNGANYINATQSSLNFCATQHIFYNETVGTEFARITSSGNYKPAVAGTGIDFSANTHAAGMTSELLTWYEEGTWTPADGSGAALSFGNTANNCFYTRVGRMVICIFGLSYPVTADASAAALTGLPFVSKSSASNVAGGYTTYTDAGFQIQLLVGNNDTSVTLWKNTGGSVSNAELSGKWLRGVVTYFV